MSGKHSFTYVPNEVLNPYDLTSVEVSTTAVTLEQIIQSMEAYLLACGFVLGEGCHLGIKEDYIPRTAVDDDGEKDAGNTPHYAA